MYMYCIYRYIFLYLCAKGFPLAKIRLVLFSENTYLAVSYMIIHVCVCNFSQTSQTLSVELTDNGVVVDEVIISSTETFETINGEFLFVSS